MPRGIFAALPILFYVGGNKLGKPLSSST